MNKELCKNCKHSHSWNVKGIIVNSCALRRDEVNSQGGYPDNSPLYFYFIVDGFKVPELCPYQLEHLVYEGSL